MDLMTNVRLKNSCKMAKNSPELIRTPGFEIKSRKKHTYTEIDENDFVEENLIREWCKNSRNVQRTFHMRPAGKH